MERLLAAGAGGGCLARQTGRVAARNSCRTPWSANFDVQATFWPAVGLRPRRFTLSVTAGNVLTGVDRLLHGAAGMHGWGQELAPDATLLSVRGWDSGARAYRYEVNPAFGTGRSASRPGLRPFSITLQGRWTVGSDPVRQPLLAVYSSIRVQGRTPAQLRAELARTIPNVPAQVLALDGELHLALDAGQRSRVHAAADTLGRALAPLADSLAQAMSASETSGDPKAVDAARARVRELSARAQALLDGSVTEVRAVLSAEQWSRLPMAVKQPSRQILPMRGFTIDLGEPW
jgi:hypothetical protein